MQKKVKSKAKVSADIKTKPTTKLKNKTITKAKIKNSVFANKHNIVLAIVIVFILAILVICTYLRKGDVAVKTEKVNSTNELQERLGINIKEPINSDKIDYAIENDDVAVVKYTIYTDGGGTMNMTLRSSSSLESIKLKLKNEWGARILMTTICDDESDVGVESAVATDNPRVMKAEWYDNDLYYTMTTDNLVSREDFLQEVNRVIISNHIEF